MPGAVLDACRRHRTPRLILASSFYVYSGCAPETHVDEGTPLELAPTDLFGAAKLASEHLTAAYDQRYHLDTVVLRLGSAYGPGQCSNAVAGLLDEALTTGRITVWGDPGRRNQYVHVQDLAAAAALALTAATGTYNLTNAEITETQQLADVLAAATGAEIYYERDRPTPPPFPFIQSARASQTLGWNPRPLATGVTDLLARRTTA